MTTEKLLAELGTRNIRLRRDRDELMLIGNHAALEPSLISQVRAHKASLLELLDRGSSLTLNPGAKITPEMVTLVEMTQEEIDSVSRHVLGGMANVQDIYPLAPLQEGILFHHLMMEGKGDPYVLGILMRFESRDRMEKYLQAVQWVVDRHDILRTGIVWEGLREPVQVVWRKAQVGVEEVELGQEGDAAEKLYERFHPRRIRMDVRHAPLLRAVVAQDRKDKSWLMMRLVHHLIGDHYSMDLMQDEIGAYLQGQQEELPEATPFRDLLAQVRLGVGKEEHERYFRAVLGEVKEPTAPFGLMQVLGDGSGIHEETLNLEAGLITRLRERARKLRVSAAILFHVAWACVVARTSSREEAVFGTVLFGQLQRGMSEKRVMGVFINTLPVRIAVGEDGLEAAVRKTQEALAELARHEHASLVLAQRCSGVPAPQPLFTSLLNYRHINVSAAGTKEAHVWNGIRNLRGEERSNYPLSLSVNDLGKTTSVTAQTDASIDPMRVCKFMCKALESLVEALETDCSRKISTIDVLPTAEREQILYEWNETEEKSGKEKRIEEIFEEQARRQPDAVGVVHEGEALSYGELNRRANRLGHYLRRLGVRPDSRVAICMERGAEMVIGILAILKAGGAYVPLDPAYPRERLLYMLEDSEAVLVLTQSDMRAQVEQASGGVAVMEVGAGCAVEGMGERNLGRELRGSTVEDLAYVIYTSGSSGKPKGVMVPHRGVRRLVIEGGYAKFEAGDGVGFASNPAFDAATMEIWGALLNGGRVVVIGQDVLLDAKGLGEELKREGVSILWLTVGLFNQYVEELKEEFGGLRYLVVGGDALEIGAIRKVLEGRRPEHLLNGYGPTETTTFALTHEIREVGEQSSIPIGKPIGNTQVYILDGEGEPVPQGVRGELYIGGEGVARGYLKRAELTGERFLPDAYRGKYGERMYRTGDLGKWRKDGTVEFLGRNDDQVKVRGYRIELGEIEEVLRGVEGVGEVVVMARKDGAGNKYLAGYYTVESERGEGTGAEQLRAYMAAKLPEYMVPAAYVRMEKMPLTANGKLDRNSLPAPEGDAYALRQYQAPEGETEVGLAAIWAELLGVERVGRKDNFFELGGHSLLALQVIARIQRQLGREAALKDLFAYPQLESFAAVLELPRVFNAELALPIRAQGGEAPVFFTHSADDQTAYAWTIAPQIDSDTPVYELAAQQQNDMGRLRTIEGQAQRMVRMVRAVQPLGPYRIVGYCFGSFLAYEIARQLAGMDEHVFLALFDFRLISGQTDRLPLVGPATVNQDLKIKFLKAIRDNVVATKMPESMQQSVAELRQSSKSMEELFYHCKDMSLLPEPWTHLTPARMQRLLVHLVDLERSPYLFSLLPMDVHMFVARDAQGAADLPADFLDLVPGTRLKILQVPGNHDTMVQSANARWLGAALSQAIKEDSKTKSSTSGVSSPVRLSNMQSGTPVFCVPGVGMHANSFVGLVSAFRFSRPAYAFEPRGRKEGDIPHTTIESAAKFYLKELETAYPSGPVHLLGHARGGWVAFEMALMLQSSGRDVLSLTLLDTDSPDESSRDLREYTLREVVGNLLEYARLALHRSVISLAELAQEPAPRQREILLDLLIQSGMLPAKAENADLYYALQIIGTGLRTRYIPHRTFSGSLHFIHAAESTGAEENQDSQKAISRWERWASSITLHRSPGNSITMLHSPHLKSLAEIVEDEMNRSSGSVLSQSAACT